MRTLVVGAGGFLGAEIVRALALEGDPVRGLVRTPAAADRVRNAGGDPVPGDVLDPESVRRAVAGCEVIVHVAAASGSSPAYAEQVRVDGARNLLAAAREAHARRLVVGSGYWVYRGSEARIAEDAPVDPRGESRVNFATEQVARSASVPSGVEVLVARPAMVYGDGAWFRPMAEGIRAGTYRVIGAAANRWSFVSVRDCGSAFAAIARRGQPGGTYNVADDRPAPWGEFARFVADELRADPPAELSLPEAEQEYGREVAHHLAADRALSADRLRALGWRPTQASYREGVRPVLAEMVSKK